MGGEARHESHLRAGFALRRELLWGEVVGTLIVLDAAATFIAAAKGEDCKEKNGDIEQFSFHIDGGGCLYGLGLLEEVDDLLFVDVAVMGCGYHLAVLYQK